MKRVIFGILVLLAAWQLIQVPSISAALFAFLTLGINPLTNHQLSTPSLISLLIALGFVAILLFFSRALSDFLGGISDWLTRVEREYKALADDAIPQPLNMASLPARAVMDDLSNLRPAPAGVAFGSFIATARQIQLPALTFGRTHSYASQLGQRYARFVSSLRSRLQRLKVTTVSKREVAPKQEEYNKNLAAELAEVLALFEKMACDVEAAEPEEAVIVERMRPSLMALKLHKQVAAIQHLISNLQTMFISDAAKTSVQASRITKATENQVVGAAHAVDEFLTHIARVVYRAVYRGILLVTLACLLAAGWLVRSVKYLAGHIRKAAVLCAVTITLSMFATGRGIAAVVYATGRGLAVISRVIYWLLSNAAMLVFLAAGYLLFAFALVCFMVWEVCEPYARKLDGWLGDNIDGNDELSEATKIGREMSRTFVQWYHELRKIKHSIYH